MRAIILQKNVVVPVRRHGVFLAISRSPHVGIARVAGSYGWFDQPRRGIQDIPCRSPSYGRSFSGNEVVPFRWHDVCSATGRSPWVGIARVAGSYGWLDSPRRGVQDIPCRSPSYGRSFSGNEVVPVRWYDVCSATGRSPWVGIARTAGSNGGFVWLGIARTAGSYAMTLESSRLDTPQTSS